MIERETLFSDTPRTVTQDGWPYQYRAHIIRASWFGKPRWRFVVEKKWVHWTHFKTSRRFKTPKAAVEAATLWLDNREANYNKSFV